jgi:hypothetical protein
MEGLNMAYSRDIKVIDIPPERILAALQNMPEVIEAIYRDGRFYVLTNRGEAEIKIVFLENGNEGHA